MNDLLKKTDTINKIEQVVYDKTIQNLEVTLLKKIEVRYEKYISHELKHSLIANQLQPILRDTEKYIDKLQRNSIVNLIIGIVGTITSITILAITILGTSNQRSKVEDFMIDFLPKSYFCNFHSTLCIFLFAAL